MLSLLIFVIQLYLLMFLAIGLHYASSRIGLAPLLFILAGMIGILNIVELNTILITLPNGITLRPGGHILIPVSLAIVLMLYIAQGTRPAQMAVIGIMGVNLVVLATLLFLLMYVNFQSPDTTVVGVFTDSTVFNLQFVRQMIASLIAFTADLLIMVIVYQGITNHVKQIPNVLVAGIALIVALWTDTVIFNIGSFIGTDNFTLFVPDDILVKTGVGILLTPLLGWYLTRIAPEKPIFVGGSNRHTLAIFFRTSLSERKLETLETELRISRTVYNQLTQHIEEIFWLIDVEEHRFLYVSPAYERITKYSVAPLYEDLNHFVNIIHEEDRTYSDNDILQFLTEERDVEFRIVSPNKIVRWLRARFFPIKDESGVVIRYAGVAEDITERKKLADQDFELAVARERMQILHDFIRDASHDLKTPISSMVLKLGLLDRIQDEAKRQVIRDEIRGRALYLSELITDLFTLSRIEGNLDNEMESINLNNIVEGVIQDTLALAEEKQLNFTVDMTADDTSLIGNPEQIHRVVSNLVSNAIRYTNEGGIGIVTIVLNSEVILQVKDTGIGIKAENIPLIFERFYRTDRAKDTQDGTGLGLAISKAVVDQHRGKLTVVSRFGEGSTFTLTLPKTQTEPQEEQDIRRITQEIRTV
ncbi:MAG: PAS domain-containing sensor histidine kinase [Chloroflexota bacterium]